jgi:transposase
MAFYSVRSDRLFCEQLDYNLLFRWFLDMDMVEGSLDHSSCGQLGRNSDAQVKQAWAGRTQVGRDQAADR